MVRAASKGSSVEGEKLSLVTRQFFSIRPIKCLLTKKIRYGFRLGIHGEAAIHEAYADPENTVYYTTSLTAVDDKVHGTSLTGWAYKPLGEPNIQKQTHTHSGASLRISGGCLAQVDAPPRDHLDSPDIAERNPPIEQKLREDPSDAAKAPTSSA